MRNCLKLSQAARTKCSRFWLRHLSSVSRKQKAERSLKRSSFQEVRNSSSFAQWHLCISQSMFMCLSSLQKLLCVSVRGLCWNCCLIQNIRLYFTAVLSQKQGRSWIHRTHPDWFTLSVGNGKPLLRILSWLICSMSGLLWQPFSIYSVRSTRSWAAAHVALIKKSFDNWPFHFPSLNNCDLMLQIGWAAFHTATALHKPLRWMEWPKYQQYDTNASIGIRSILTR